MKALFSASIPLNRSFRLIEEPGYLRVEVDSDVTLDDLLEAYRSTAESDQKTPLPRLWMLPETITELSLDELRTLASAGESYEVAGKAAIVSPGDLGFGMGRQATLVRHDAPDRFGVFRTEAEALAWLGVEAPVEDGGDAAD